MTPTQLAEIEARLRGIQAEYAQADADDDYWSDRETIATFQHHAPADIAALIAALKERDAMMRRAIKYAKEDRMKTPGNTRLQRVLDEMERAL